MLITFIFSFELATDDTMAFEHYSMSFINYVERPTQSEKDITSQDLAAGKERLLNITHEYQPKLICFVGKKCCQYQLYVPRTNNNNIEDVLCSDSKGIPVFLFLTVVPKALKCISMKKKVRKEISL